MTMQTETKYSNSKYNELEQRAKKYKLIIKENTLILKL